MKKITDFIFKMTPVFIMVFGVGCASIDFDSKRGHVQVTRLAKPMYERCSVSLINIRTSELLEGMVELLPTKDVALFDPARKAIEESGVCRSVEWREQKFMRLPMLKPHSSGLFWFNFNVKDAMDKVDADLNIDFYFKIEEYENVFITTLMTIPSIATLGFFPIWVGTKQQAWVTTRERNSEQYTFSSLDNRYTTWKSNLFFVFPNRRPDVNGELLAQQKSVLGLVKSSINGITDFKKR